MSRIGDSSGSGPTWPSSLPEDHPGNEGAGKSEFDKALDRQQRGIQVNPLAVTPAERLTTAETDEQDDSTRITPASEAGAGDNQDHGKKDPYADIDWRIRQQLDL